MGLTSEIGPTNEWVLALIFGVLSPNQKGLPILFTNHVEFGESLSVYFKGCLDL